MNRMMQRVTVTKEVWKDYRRATGLGKLLLHYAIFYSHSKSVDPVGIEGEDYHHILHPILCGKIPNDYAFGERKYNRIMLADIEREVT